MQSTKHVLAMLTLVSVALFGADRATAAKYTAGEVKDGGTIVGVVKWEGAIPKQATLSVTGQDKPCHTKPIKDESIVVSDDGKVRWAVAYIKKITHGKPFGADADKPVILDQHGCQFSPHVVTVQKGQPLRVLNSDGVLHNVHLYAKKNEPFNRSMPGGMKQLDVTFKYTERIHIGCDIHPWMSGWVVVAKHPYYAVTDEAGSFRLEGVPAGTYTIEVWQEKIGRKTAEVTVTAGKEASVEFILKQK
jgi:plastocyanin